LLKLDTKELIAASNALINSAGFGVTVDGVELTGTPIEVLRQAGTDAARAGVAGVAGVDAAGEWAPSVASADSAVDRYIA
jgi:hypothetical protein